MSKDKLIIEIDLDKGDTKRATAKLKNEAGKAGTQAGKRLGENFDKQTESSFKGIAKKATAILAGVAAVRALARSFDAAISAARQQEDAILALNSSLELSRNSSVNASQGIQEFASELQKASRFGDEVIIQNAALIQSLGDLDEQGLKRATQASADLATALRIDLRSAATLVGKAAAGEVGSFSRYGLIIKKGADNTETFARALEAIEGKFGGAAQRDIGNYSGTVDQASNAFGDLLEEVGFFITKNPVFVSAIQTSTKMIEDFAGGLAGIRELTGFTDAPVGELAKIDDAIAKNVDRQQTLIQTLESTKEGLFGTGFLTAGAERDLEVLPSRIKAIEDEIAQQVKERSRILKESSNVAVAANQAEVQSAESKLNSLQLFAQAQIQNEELIIQQQQQRFLALQELRNRDLVSQEEFLIQRELIEQEATERANMLAIQNRDLQLQNGELTKEMLVQNLKDIGDATQNAFSNMGQSSQELGKELANLGVRGFGTLGRNIGAALANGTSVNEAFVESVKATATQAAEAFGDYYIKLGVVRVAAGDPSGGAVLAGGIALKALAGALGSGGGASSGGGGAGSFNSQGFQEPFQENVADPQNIERAEERTNLSLNIEGSLVRESELNGYISEILEEGSSRNATIIPSLRTS